MARLPRYVDLVHANSLINKLLTNTESKIARNIMHPRALARQVYSLVCLAINSSANIGLRPLIRPLMRGDLRRLLAYSYMRLQKREGLWTI